MAHITEEHLHHMARRHHATMKKLDAVRENISGLAQKGFGLLETGAGAWAGGMLEGRTGGKALGPLPYNLIAGVGFLVMGYTNLGGEKYSEHFNNIGNGFVGSYFAALGYAFGKRWKETGKMLGGGGHPWASPYENGWPHEAGPAVHGDLTEAQMAAIVQRMQQAAAAPAHP